MTQCEWHDEWKSADLWSEADLQALCCGLEPNAGRPCTAQLNDAAEKIRRAVLAKVLPVASQPADATDGDRMYGHYRFFDPATATSWAKPKFPAFFPYSAADFNGPRAFVGAAANEMRSRESTYLNIIGALLELVLGKTPAGNPQSVFESQAAIIDALIAHHGTKSGISKTTLEAKFADARRQLNST